MTRKCLLFAYGLLQPGHSPPRSVSASWPDRIHAVLYDLGPYPVAVRVDATPDWIDGHTLELDADELALLDEFEDVEGGEFRRRLTQTEKGHTAWVYEYGLAEPTGVAPQARWPKS